MLDFFDAVRYIIVMTQRVVKNNANNLTNKPIFPKEITNMAKKTATPELDEVEMDEERNRFFETSRKVLLAAIGAVALAQDEAEDFVARLVERGEIAERDARKLLREMTDKRRKNTEGELDKRVETLLEKLNVPTKADIDALGHKITTLTHKIEDLKKAQA